MKFTIAINKANSTELITVDGPHAAINKFNDIKERLGIGGTNLDCKGNLTASNKDYTLTLTSN